MRSLLFLLPICLLSCQPETCPFDNIDWMTVSEQVDQQKQSELATELQASARASAKKLGQEGDADAALDVMYKFQSEIQRQSDGSYTVSQEFFQAYKARTTAMCSVWQLLKSDNLSAQGRADAERNLMKMAEDLSQFSNQSESTPNDPEAIPEVRIGNRIWMTRNLDITQVTTGSAPPCFNKETHRCTTAGRLYTWRQAKAACEALPGGWRLPNQRDMEDLNSAIGEKTKSYGSLLKGGTSGFQAVLGGLQDSEGAFKGWNTHGYYWLNMGSQTDKAACLNFRKDRREVKTELKDKMYKLSCRCVRDI